MAQSSEDWSLYAYPPSKGAPMFFAVFLTMLGGLQIYQSFVRYRWKKFGAFMVWATTVWIAGFICRSISVYQDQNIGMYIAQYVLVLMGPPLYAAAEYFILGRLMAYLPYHAPLHPGRVLSTFVMLSVCIESLTANGAANSAGSGRKPGQRKAGLDCLKAALILQCCVEVLYLSLVVILERRCRRAGHFPRHVRTVCYVLYLTSGMMLMRCIVRTIEGFENSKCSPENPLCGYMTRHEWVLWVFEVANITVFVVVLAAFHPGRFLPRSSKIYLDPTDYKTERLGPGFGRADKRPLLMTVIDPFNIGGIVSGRGMAMTRFWDEQHPIYKGKSLTAAKSGSTEEALPLAEAGPRA